MTQSGLDVTLFYLINGLHGRLLDPVVVFWSSPPMYAIPIAILLFTKDRKAALIALFAAMASFAVADWGGNLLKHLIERPRPCHVLPDVKLLAGCSDSYSMPSNHTTDISAVATAIFLLTKSRLRYLMIPAVLMIAFSRVYMGVHYPTDLLGGAVVGAAAGVAISYYFKWAMRKGTLRGAMIIFLTGMTLFRVYYILNGNLELSGDEAHYWEWSRRLDVSYYSKGPLIAYIIRLGTMLFGNTELGVRFFAPLMSLGGSLILYRLGSLLYDEETGIYSAIVFQLIPLFSAFGVIMTIDAPFTFLWIASLLVFYRAVSLKRLPEWLLLGFFVGLGILAKFTMAFFMLSVLLFLIASKDDRGELLSPRPYLGLFVSLLMMVPMVLWNIDHNWVTFRHNLNHADLEAGFRVSLPSLAEFVGSQVGAVTPLLFLTMLYALVKTRKEDRFSFWFAMPTLVFFLLKSIQAKVQANWAMTGYITGIFAFSQVYMKDIRYESAGKKALAVSTLLMLALVSAVSFYPQLIRLPLKLDPSARLRGWKAAAHEADLSLPPPPYFVFSDNYQLSSELAFYMKGHPVTYCANTGRRFNQYDLWPGFEGLKHQNALFVKIGDSGMPGELKEAFARCDKKPYTVYEKNRPLRSYSIFTCYDFKGMKEDNKAHSY
ncbi:MAG: glycosyltransferase family 39 protein [Nitrospiraceae bacterium]|nr:glycosyltransferase family 39 protein [Nitrospiraceae bacterium]